MTVQGFGTRVLGLGHLIPKSFGFRTRIEGLGFWLWGVRGSEHLIIANHCQLHMLHPPHHQVLQILAKKVRIGVVLAVLHTAASPATSTCTQPALNGGKKAPCQQWRLSTAIPQKNSIRGRHFCTAETEASWGGTPSSSAVSDRTETSTSSPGLLLDIAITSSDNRYASGSSSSYACCKVMHENEHCDTGLCQVCHPVPRNRF